ncbi:hypothetical protein RF11_16363 [Thelohanellus kitauei]|uniref:Uncharacterized protein n=1 Tax=Thelohanellus kitauei TaxID=669202 RepID=A0A0C2MPG7_THEKT|nr:hypothetical protein RF11_16363 [Thelohanellus kitauei]
MNVFISRGNPDNFSSDAPKTLTRIAESIVREDVRTQMKGIRESLAKLNIDMVLKALKAATIRYLRTGRTPKIHIWNSPGYVQKTMIDAFIRGGHSPSHLKRNAKDKDTNDDGLIVFETSDSTSSPSIPPAQNINNEQRMMDVANQNFPNADDNKNPNNHQYPKAGTPPIEQLLKTEASIILHDNSMDIEDLKSSEIEFIQDIMRRQDELEARRNRYPKKLVNDPHNISTRTRSEEPDALKSSRKKLEDNLVV